MLQIMGERAKTAEPVMRTLSTEKKNQALRQAAEDLVKKQEDILAANEIDVKAGKEAGMSEGLLDRLALNPDRIEAMAEGLRQLAGLEDPIGGHGHEKKAKRPDDWAEAGSPGRGGYHL